MSVQRGARLHIQGLNLEKIMRILIVGVQLIFGRHGDVAYSIFKGCNSSNSLGEVGSSKLVSLGV